MKTTQTTIYGEPELKLRNKRAKTINGLKYIPSTGESFDDIINDLKNIHGRSKFYALTSGGKDSMNVAHRLAVRGELEACVHIKTNIGISKTTEFIQEECDKQGWKLYIIEPQPKFLYTAFVLQYGFPVKNFHNMIMGYLKYQTMRNFALDSRFKKDHCLISGVRKFESEQRFGNYPEPIQTDGQMWFGCPLFYMKDDEVYRYVLENGLRITPVHDLLGFSGECMCGSFAVAGQKQMIRDIDPKLADFIEWLEDGVARFGTSQAKRYGKWGGHTKMSELEEQQMITDFFQDHPELQAVEKMAQTICGVECGAGTMRGMMDY